MQNPASGRPPTFAAILLALLLLSTLTAPASPSEIPTRIGASNQTGWVAAAEIIDPSTGDFAWETLSPEDEAIFRETAASLREPRRAYPWSVPTEECTLTSRLFVHSRRASAPTLEEQIGTSHNIFFGVVAEVSEGFKSGLPTTLLRLTDVELVRDEAGLSDGGSLLFYYPHARIELADGTLCRAGDRFPEHPDLGAKVLIFTDDFVDYESTGIAYPFDNDIIFQNPGSSEISFPRTYGKLKPEGEDFLFENLLTEVRRLAGQATR